MSRLPPQVPWRRFLHVLGKLGYAPQKGKAGSARSFRNSTRNPNVVTFREPHPGQNVRQTMLHEYLRFSTPQMSSCGYWKTARSAVQTTTRGHLDRIDGNSVRPMKRLAASAGAVLVPCRYAQNLSTSET